MEMQILCCIGATLEKHDFSFPSIAAPVVESLLRLLSFITSQVKPNFRYFRKVPLLSLGERMQQPVVL